MVVKTAALAELDVAGLAAAAGSQDYYYDNGELICNDITQAALDAAVAAYDHLAVLKRAACARIDAHAGEIRAGYVSPGSLVEQEYQRALDEAVKWLVDTNQVVPSSVQSWADASGMLPADAAANIVATGTAMNTALDSIRAARLAGKASVNAAADVAGIGTAEAAAITALDACKAP